MPKKVNIETLLQCANKANDAASNLYPRTDKEFRTPFFNDNAGKQSLAKYKKELRQHVNALLPALSGKLNSTAAEIQ